MANEAKKNDLKRRWEDILSFKLKNPKDADDIEAAVKEFRKGFKIERV